MPLCAKKLMLPLAVSAVLAGCNGSGSDNNDDNTASPLSMTLLHMNDHHSHLRADSFDYDVSALGLSATTESGESISEIEVSYGGFPMLKSLFDQKTSESSNVLKIHSGDAITGTLYYTLFNGSADATMMNQICFDAFALGNHEFDGGDAGLATFLDSLNSGSCGTPTLAANVVPAQTSAIREGYIQPYVVKEIEGEKVGLIGLDIAQKTKESSRPDDGTEFLDEQITAQQYIDELKGQGVNKIILVTHVQYEKDRELARNLSGVDVIVGGDSHSLLGDDTFTQLGFNTVGEYPTIETNADGDRVCVVQAWEYAHLMGKLDIDFDAEGKVTSCSGMPMMPIEASYRYEFADDDTRILDSADTLRVSQALTSHDELVVVTPDNATEQLLVSFDSELDALKQQVIGTVSDNLCLERWPGQGRSSLCNVSETYTNGSDISNLVAKAFLTVTPTADIAIQNGGGVRVDVASGDYTIADAYTLLPFSNTLVTLEMTGAQIVQVLEEALANTLDNGGSSGSYPYASGLRFHIDASAQGRRVSAVQVNSRIAGLWTDIDLNATYTVVTNDFIASGRDGYDTFGTVYNAGHFTDTYTEYAQGFVDYMKQLTEQGQTLTKLPVSEYSTQSYTGRDGCNHSLQSDCSGY
ncbi:NAD nucleotidase [Oceanospirillum sediminis]|uniref:NAD nucleotidase n=1 Tax=Oceanospirillum sediminis TaxID=2760088 RepID=A0A839IL70_9GAMM|nr:NAD nucleotidase [Oceanospirillum sediminis]MBB1485237.1 NAD nucleotidase [Oceanospirillum sediminis]